MIRWVASEDGDDAGYDERDARADRRIHRVHLFANDPRVLTGVPPLENAVELRPVSVIERLVPVLVILRYPATLPVMGVVIDNRPDLGEAPGRVPHLISAQTLAPKLW